MRQPARRRTGTQRQPATPHGAPALLIVDMISRFDFPDGARLAEAALPVAARIAQLRARFHRRGWPVLFANDNFADWRTDFEGLWTLCADPKQRGARIAACLAPRPQDYYVLKPKHSAFLGSALALLLARLQTTRLLVTGIATDACVLATAIDARMRACAISRCRCRPRAARRWMPGASNGRCRCCARPSRCASATGCRRAQADERGYSAVGTDIGSAPSPSSPSGRATNGNARVMVVPRPSSDSTSTKPPAWRTRP
ncbi:hypothetical protein NB697_000796 [Xanthomonas sacchari]|nr:hypothetical protein [Xanthomonas sacchari]